MLFMVVERFRDGDAAPVYRRVSAQGRMAPEGVTYVNSWVSADLKMCWQVMEAPDRARLDAWIARWADLVDFDVIPVITSAEAAEAIAPRL